MSSILYIGNKLSNHGFTPGVIETLGKQLEHAGYRMSYAGTYKNKVLRLLEMFVKSIIYGVKSDYILIDTYSTNAFWYAYLTGNIARLMGKRFITVLHGGDLPSRLARSKKACDQLFKHSYANVAVSGYLKKAFEDAGYKALVIPNNIDISLYKFKLRESPQPKLLWVRSFHKIYNANMAIDVLKLLLEKYPEAELCMVGPDRDGSRNDFEKYAQNMGVKSKIKITGGVTKSEWIKLSENYDFFINTTNVDNTPVSVIEAMALGLCVITTDVGGIPFLVEANKDAILVKQENPSQMAYEIKKLLDCPQKVLELSLSGREKAMTFDWKIIKEKWFKLLLN